MILEHIKLVLFQLMDNLILKHKLKNINCTDLNTLIQKIDNGAQFIVFNYRIGLGAINILKFSPAILINNTNEFNYYKNKYCKYNFLFGPWSIVKGPFLTYDIHKSNKNGGINVTKDIMLNIDEKAITNNEIDIKEVYSIYHPITDKTDLKTFDKSIKEINRNKIPLKNSYIALFINVDQYTEPYFTIGIDTLNDSPLDIEYLEECLYKYFMKHVYFEILDLRENDLLNDRLVELGTQIYPLKISSSKI